MFVQYIFNFLSVIFLDSYMLPAEFISNCAKQFYEQMAMSWDTA